MSGCCGGGGGREKEENISATHKWDYINLSDFKSSSCFTPLSYGVLYISLIISVAVYIVDIFVAFNLLLYNKWAGQIKPWLDLKYSRWIFAGCIILSLVILVYRWIHAIRAIRSGGIAQSYLDPLAVCLQSVRTGKRGRGWRRFLVFAELTKSKKGAEYIALFTYFSFESWIRVVFAEGPRKVINAITLYSVLDANLIPVGDHGARPGGSAVGQFLENIKIYAEGDNQRAAILFSMLFTLIIWVLAALSLILSCLFYILFLWHHIPTQDGGLRKYCKRKIDSRLQKIVDAKVKKALAKEDSKLGLKSSKGNSTTDFKRQPTVPVLSDEDSLPDRPLARQGTTTTLGSETLYSRDLERQDGGSTIRGKRPLPLSRVATNASTASASSNAPLMGTAGSMGHGAPGRPYSPAPSPFGNSSQGDLMTPTDRTFTPFSNSGVGPPRPPISASNRSNGHFHPGPPPRQGTSSSRYTSNDYFTPAQVSRQNTSLSNYTSNGRASPAPTLPVQEFEMRSQIPQSNYMGGSNIGGGGFMAYNPSMNSSASAMSPTQRNFSAPPPRSYTSTPSRGYGAADQPSYQQRSGTAPPGRPNNTYDASIYDSY